jgi:spoIIIJ-associated protein
MRTIETTGKTPEEAIEAALDQLGAGREEVAIDVVNQGKGGLLGIGSEPAIVRVTLLESEDKPAEDNEPDDEAQPDALAEFAAFADDLDDDPEDIEDYEEEGESSEVVRVGYDVLSTLLGKMGVTADVYLRDPYTGDEEGPVFEIEGDDSGLLIGTRGETLRALQFIVSFLVSRKMGERTNMMVDVEGYQQRRYDSVANLARRVAQRVAQSGRSIPLEPMPPNERRQVHMALADHADVATESDGYGDGRKVVIHPK